MTCQISPTNPDTEPTARLGRIAILWRGDEAARRSASPGTSRFSAVFAALADVGVDAEPVIYEDDVLDAVRTQLATFDGVLVWVNPIHEGRNRANLDALLRDVEARGVWVSAHPDVILKMGTKEVLHRTRMMSWGCDTALYRTLEQMRVELPLRLAAGPRVIKRNRGNGGQGVWKVEALASPPARPMVRVLDATSDASEDVALDEFLERCIEYFEDGSVIDQPFQPRLSEGVMRCYMAGDRCAGFGYHKVKALVDQPTARAEAGPRLYTNKADPRFQGLRRLMEDEWTPQLTSLLDIPSSDLPMIWDADFMLGPTRSDGTDSYVLGEINVSSVFPIPDEAPAEIARRVADRLQSKL
ncbi:Cj0069 family protein [Bradyrhizobium sp. ISRA435]|nr:Cj0069 family protein [Bradyrhizobium sp. ISRA435]